jgi:hypothetical protein
MAKAPTKKAVVAPKKAVVATKKVAPKKSVKAEVVAPKVADIPILMRVTEPKIKKPRFKKSKLMTPMELLLRTNSLSAVGIAFLNGLNGGLVAVTMLLMLVAFVTEIFVAVVRDYSEANEQLVKYKNLIKNKVKRK